MSHLPSGEQLGALYPRGRRACQELRDGGNKLSGREGLRQHDTVGDALYCPIVTAFAAHINHRKCVTDGSAGWTDFGPFQMI